MKSGIFRGQTMCKLRFRWGPAPKVCISMGALAIFKMAAEITMLLKNGLPFHLFDYLYIYLWMPLMIHSFHSITSYISKLTA